MYKMSPKVCDYEVSTIQFLNMKAFAETDTVAAYRFNFEVILKFYAFYAERVNSPFLNMTLHFAERTTPRN